MALLFMALPKQYKRKQKFVHLVHTSKKDTRGYTKNRNINSCQKYLDHIIIGR